MSDGLVDHAALDDMAEGCGWTRAEFVARYREEADREMAAIDAALATGEGAEAARRAHGFAGASVMAGIPGMHAALRLVEAAARSGDLAGARSRFGEAAGVLARVKRALSPDA